ncbi:hypothetical protein Fmac_011768 [Flemingia macrophylla]|uniref:Uncharacterized protein n=1 Tax=Flemingia macrophylla TaxID=520843 RepID=A0ABD1MP86_9FABA
MAKEADAENERLMKELQELKLQEEESKMKMKMLEDEVAELKKTASFSGGAGHEASQSSLQNLEHVSSSQSTTSAQINTKRVRNNDLDSYSIRVAQVSVFSTIFEVNVFLRHDAFEAAVPAGPSDSGLVSKWRPKDSLGEMENEDIRGCNAGSTKGYHAD